jgi:hypothetical protein
MRISTIIRPSFASFALPKKLIPAGAALAVGALFALIASPAATHEWFSGKRNPANGMVCCNEVDCMALDDGAWRREGDLYVVRWQDGRDYSIPAREALPSQDRQGRAAACVMHGKMRCFFLPTAI